MKSILNTFKRNNIQSLLFVVLLLVIYAFYNYHEILFLRPQGIHFQRQTDSLAFVLGYYKYGMNFFEPKGLNLLSDGGRAVSEFPILYYVTACLYFLFGEKEFILRLINICIVSTGLFYLFKLLRNILEDSFYAFVLTFLFLSSTVLIYYTNNFLPDVSALGFSLIGWYFFYDYLLVKKKKQLLKTFLFFVLASLLKATFFINPVAAIISILYIEFKDSKLRQTRLPLLIFLIGLLINVLWILFVIYYNKSNGDNYFTTNIRPIWRLSTEAIIVVWDYIANYWYTNYYFESTIHFMLVIVVLGIFYIKKSRVELIIPATLMFIGSVIYILFFYEMFQDHDYYFITIIPTIIFISTTTFLGIKNKFPKLINHFATRIILLLICVLSINYSEMKLSQRYDNSEFLTTTQQFNGWDDYLTELDNDNYSKVVVVKDVSRNGSLYLLKRQGWIEKDFSNLNEIKIFNYSNLGASYLIITDKSKVHLFLKYGKLIGEKNGLTILDISKTN